MMTDGARLEIPDQDVLFLREGEPAAAGVEGHAEAAAVHLEHLLAGDGLRDVQRLQTDGGERFAVRAASHAPHTAGIAEAAVERFVLDVAAVIDVVDARRSPLTDVPGTHLAVMAA